MDGGPTGRTPVYSVWRNWVPIPALVECFARKYVGACRWAVRPTTGASAPAEGRWRARRKTEREDARVPEARVQARRGRASARAGHVLAKDRGQAQRAGDDRRGGMQVAGQVTANATLEEMALGGFHAVPTRGVSNARIRGS
jgi:hypothetical protein